MPAQRRTLCPSDPARSQMPAENSAQGTRIEESGDRDEVEDIEVDETEEPNKDNELIILKNWIAVECPRITTAHSEELSTTLKPRTKSSTKG